MPNGRLEMLWSGLQSHTGPGTSAVFAVPTMKVFDDTLPDEPLRDQNIGSTKRLFFVGNIFCMLNISQKDCAVKVREGNPLQKIRYTAAKKFIMSIVGPFSSNASLFGYAELMYPAKRHLMSKTPTGAEVPYVRVLKGCLTDVAPNIKRYSAQLTG